MTAPSMTVECPAERSHAGAMPLAVQMADQPRGLRGGVFVDEAPSRKERLSALPFLSASLGGEGEAHRNLKRLALAWARTQRLRLAATEVRLPRSPYRADIAAATPRVLSARGLTAVFECKASRADFLRDGARESVTTAKVVSLACRLKTLRELIAAHRPDLRQGDELFAEFDAYDLRGLRHATHDRLAAELRAAQRKLLEGTKFAKLGRWRAASLLYVVAEPGVMAPDEVPEGWGLLVRQGEALELVARPCLLPTTPEARVAMVEAIAAVAGKARI